jgi:hypothetical protein
LSLARNENKKVEIYCVTDRARMPGDRRGKWHLVKERGQILLSDFNNSNLSRISTKHCIPTEAYLLICTHRCSLRWSSREDPFCNVDSITSRLRQKGARWGCADTTGISKPVPAKRIWILNWLGKGIFPGKSGCAIEISMAIVLWHA